MSCWESLKPRISPNFNYTNRISSCTSSSKRSCLDSPDPTGKSESLSEDSGEERREIIFIRTGLERSGKEPAPTGNGSDNSNSQQRKPRWIFGQFLHLPALGILKSFKIGGWSTAPPNPSPTEVELSQVRAPPVTPEIKLPNKMEHSELVKELSHIEKLTNQERLKLAHNRRKLQLKYWNQYEKLLNNSSMSVNTKKGAGKNSQHQKMLEQLQQQELRRKSKSNNKPNVRFCNSIMLLEAAGRNDIVEVRRLIQDDGVDPDVANEDGLTALHQCCIDDNEEMMKLLLEFGANVNSEDSEKWTPLHAAATCGHLHLVKTLIARGANLLAVNAEGNMPYDICDEEATLDYIESEMAKRGVTQELIEEIRALPETRMLEDMQRIEAEGGDLEERDQDGATYIHIAAANGYVRVVEFLLDHHVATDVQDKDCWQPVHAAACWSHIEVLELLVQSGADLNARTKNNETPYAICEDPEIKERIILLRSEQETKMKDLSVKKLRRSTSSNSRTQSIRRTSQRDKGLATKRDAADEAAMLLALPTADKESSSSPMTDTTDPMELSLPVELSVPSNQVTVSSSEDEELRSLPPWSQGRDSITQLHFEALGIPKSHHIPIDNDSSSLDESPRLNNSTKNHTTKPSKNVNQEVTGSKILKERNELNRSLKETGGTKFQNPLSVPVSNPSLETDTNANLPNPDVSPTVDVQPKIGNSRTSGSAGSNGIRICDSTDSVHTGGNSTIDIRVQVTINTNGGSMTSLGPLPSIDGVPSTPQGNQIVQVTAPVFTPPGTLSDLKKHRSLQYVSISRNSNTFPINGLKDFGPKYDSPPSPSMSLKKYSGDSVGMVGEDAEPHRKCCLIM